MDYREIMEEANRLEAQAAALRKQAEETKAQDTAKIKEARTEVFEAIINYFKANSITLEAKEIKEFEELFNILFEEFENSVKQTKKRVDMLDHIMKDMKNTNSKSTVKRIKISDDEKLLNFLRTISE